MLSEMSRRKRKALAGYLYITPWIIGFLLFVLGPMVASLGLSLTDYSITSAPSFVGLRNYRHMFTQDRLFWGSVGKTFYFATVHVAVGMVGSLVCALLLNAGLRGQTFFRTAYFIPSLTPIVALTLLWSFILQPRYGALNGLLEGIGIQGPGWLMSSQWAIPGLLLMILWATVGGQRMIVFLAGLQGIPAELYDAAQVDGAGDWGRFRHVTLPMLSPTIFFNLVLGIIGGLRAFGAAYISTGGGPAYATWFYMLHLYTQAFAYLEMGYASALAWVFLFIVLSLTAIQFSASSRWVYYEGAV